MTYLRLLRPKDWVKNLLVFAALIFSRSLTSVSGVERVFVLFWCFSALASAVYIFNDWVDAPADRLNPAKAGRPLAAGTVTAIPALSLSAGLAFIGVGGAWLLDPHTSALCGTYIAVNILYTLRLKREPILDVGCIASGFVLRTFAGATVIAVPISRWLVLCTIFLSLFLGFAKRRQEIAALANDAALHRSVLKDYSEPFLDHMNAILAAATLVTYTLYTVDAETVARFSTDKLIWTVPFVLYGILRYLYLVHQRGLGAQPTDALLRDRGMLGAVVGWVLVVAAVIYL